MLMSKDWICLNFACLHIETLVEYAVHTPIEEIKHNNKQIKHFADTEFYCVQSWFHSLLLLLLQLKLSTSHY